MERMILVLLMAFALPLWAAETYSYDCRRWTDHGDQRELMQLDFSVHVPLGGSDYIKESREIHRPGDPIFVQEWAYDLSYWRTEAREGVLQMALEEEGRRLLTIAVDLSTGQASYILPDTSRTLSCSHLNPVPTHTTLSADSAKEFPDSHP